MSFIHHCRSTGRCGSSFKCQAIAYLAESGKLSGGIILNFGGLYCSFLTEVLLSIFLSDMCTPEGPALWQAAVKLLLTWGGEVHVQLKRITSVLSIISKLIACISFVMMTFNCFPPIILFLGQSNKSAMMNMLMTSVFPTLCFSWRRNMKSLCLARAEAESLLKNEAVHKQMVSYLLDRTAVI